MPRIDDTSDRQSAFLRAFLTNPAGPPPDCWPTPARFRRWLRRDGFRRAFRAIQRATRRQAEFLVHVGSLHAAHDINASFDPSAPDPFSPARRIRNTDALKISLRLADAADRARTRSAHRAAAADRAAADDARRNPPPPPDPYANETLEEAAVRLMHPNCRPEVAIAFIKGQPHPYYKPDTDLTTDPPPQTALDPVRDRI